jgi:hypothetical protein
MTATIRIDQAANGTPTGTPGVARIDLWLSQVISLVAVNVATTYQWSFLSKPPTSTVALTGATTSNATFTPDVQGTYRIQLIQNGGGPGNVQVLVAVVRYSSSGGLLAGGLFLPGLGEEPGDNNYPTSFDPSGNTRSWDYPFQLLLEAIGGTIGIALQNGGVPLAGSPFGTLNLSGITATNSGGGVALLTASGGGGGGPSGFIIFRPGVSSAGSAVATWAEVQTAIANADGCFTVYVDSSISNAQISGGVTNCQGNVIFEGYNSPVPISGNLDVLTILDGSTLHRPRGFGGQLIVKCACATTAALSFNSSGGTTLTDIFELRDQAKLVLNAGATVPAFTVVANGTVTLITSENCTLDSSAVGSLAVIGLSTGASLNLFVTEQLTINGTNPVAGGGSTTLNISYDDTFPSLGNGLVSTFGGFGGSLVPTRIAQARWTQPSSGATSARPSGADVVTGQLYYDTTVPGLFAWNGSTWVSTGGSGSITAVTGTAPITSSGGTTPAIGITAATDSAAGSMSAADKTKLDAIGAIVTAVTGSAPISSSGGTTPLISIAAATDSTSGSMSAADKTKLDGMTAGAAVASVSGIAPIVSSGGTTPAISISPATDSTAGSMSAADKTKLDGLSSIAGAVQWIRFALGTTSASSVTSLPNNAIVICARLNITTAYSVGAAISLGVSGSISEFMATGDNNPQISSTPQLFTIDQDTSVTPSAAVLATVTGAPSVGAATVSIGYVASPNP